MIPSPSLPPAPSPPLPHRYTHRARALSASDTVTKSFANTASAQFYSKTTGRGTTISPVGGEDAEAERQAVVCLNTAKHIGANAQSI